MAGRRLQRSCGIKPRVEGNTSIKPDFRFALNERILLKTTVLEEILDRENIVLEDGVRANGNLTRYFLDLPTHHGLIPLAVRIDKAHKSNRCIGELGREPGQIVERLLGRSI